MNNFFEIKIKNAIIWSFFLHIFLILILGAYFYHIPESINMPVEIVAIDSRHAQNTYENSLKQKRLKYLKGVINEDIVPELSDFLTSSNENNDIEKNQNKNVESSNSENSDVDVKFEKNFPFAYYARIIKRKVNNNWDKPFVSGSNVKAVVYFQITREGFVINYRIYESSGEKDFDEAAIAAIKKSNPFPKLPSDYTEDQLGVYFGFAFS